MKRSITRTVTAGSAMLLSLTVVGTTAGSARPSATGHPPYGTVAVANYGNNHLLRFAPGSTGNVAPAADIGGAATGLNGPTDVAFDRAGRLYAANFTGSTLTVYQPNATGNASPAVTLAGANTTLNAPLGLDVTPNGDIWVANNGANDILEFAAGAQGNVAPTRTISGPATGLNGVDDVAVTPDGKGVWVTDFQPAGTTVEREFSTHANGNVPSISSIGGGQTQLDTPYGVDVARDGSLIFGNATSSGALLTFAPHAHGNARPRTVITGSNTGLQIPNFIGLNPVGEIWVPIFSTNTLSRFPANATGNVTPDHQITGASTALNEPSGVADYAVPPSAPRALKKHMHGKTLKLRWHRPASNGGGIEGYLVRHAKHKSGRFHTVKTTKKRHFTKHHAARGYYDVVAFNQAGYGKHSKRVHVT